MAEILGVGLTHYPPLIIPDEEGRIPLRITLARDERVPPEMKNPSNWPEPMRIEYGEDEGITAAIAHRARLVKSFLTLRDEIEAFNPDFVLIWGDDQYENFKEDIIPPFCVLAYDEIVCKPFAGEGPFSGKSNVWKEPQDKEFKYRGHAEAARFLTTSLINQGIDMAYSYKSLHHVGLAHAFINTLMYLDYDRKGFDIPIVPVAVNCYGSKVISNRGGILPHKVNGVPLPLDPPGPSPKRCMEVGAATVRALKESPWRVALVASSSWSHAFLTEKNNFLWPDIESDRARFEELSSGNYDAWAEISTATLEDAGQQELLNWACLLGAMRELDRKPEILDYLETYVLNSNKCMAIFKP